MLFLVKNENVFVVFLYICTIITPYYSLQYEREREVLSGFALLDLSSNVCDCFMRNCTYGMAIHKHKSHGRLLIRDKSQVPVTFYYLHGYLGNDQSQRIPQSKGCCGEW